MSERKSLTELAQMCRTQNNIYGGTYWQHYKGDFYKIIGFGIDEETNDLEVSYEPIQVERMTYGNKIVSSERLEGLVFHRSRTQFFCETYDNGVKMPRFRRVAMMMMVGAPA